MPRKERKIGERVRVPLIEGGIKDALVIRRQWNTALEAYSLGVTFDGDPPGTLSEWIEEEIVGDAT